MPVGPCAMLVIAGEHIGVGGLRCLGGSGPCAAALRGGAADASAVTAAIPALKLHKTTTKRSRFEFAVTSPRLLLQKACVCNSEWPWRRPGAGSVQILGYLSNRKAAACSAVVEQGRRWRRLSATVHAAITLWPPHLELRHSLCGSRVGPLCAIQLRIRRDLPLETYVPQFAVVAQ